MKKPNVCLVLLSLYFILQALFLVLKLAGYVRWSWLFVFSPAIAITVSGIVMMIVFVLFHDSTGDDMQ